MMSTAGGGADHTGAAGSEPGDVAWAREHARSLIPAGHQRWRHSQTVAVAAVEASRVVPAEDRDVLISAAWLHDIGYHHPKPPTGFHPLDGAQLVTATGWPLRVAALVAHHSQAQFMAAARGLLPQLGRYPREAGLVTDALVYADMTSGPNGRRVTLRERLIDGRRRHAGEAPARATARRLREPHLVLAVARVDVALLHGGHRAHLALPLPHPSDLPVDTLAALAETQPGRPVADLRAAVHAAVSLHEPTSAKEWAMVGECANRLLSVPAPPLGRPRT